MKDINMQELLEAGVHYGHLTRRWNPKMKPYIYGERNRIHIIDLSKTARQLKSALQFIAEAVAEGRDVLFVGTKRQAQDVIQEAADRCKMYYVNQRWLGGTLTNWKTIKTSIDRLKDLQSKKEDGTFSVLGKKELLMIDREIEKLLHSFGGIKDMKQPPGVMVVIDPQQEHIALHEASVLDIPVVALADTNCDPDPIDHLVVGNDDALRSIELFLKNVSEQVLAGLELREARLRQEAAEKAKEKKAKAAEKKETREVKVEGTKASAFVADRQGTSKADDEEVASGQYSAKVEAAPVAEVEVKASGEEGPETASSKQAESTTVTDETKE